MIIVLRIANPYIILRQITNLPQLRTSAATDHEIFKAFNSPPLTTKFTLVDISKSESLYLK